MPVSMNNVDLVEVRGQYLDHNGDGIQGRLLFTPVSDRLVNGPDLVTIVGQPRPVTLDALGRFSARLIPTDDPDINPTAWQYRVTEDFPGGRSFLISVPMVYTSTGVDLTAIQDDELNPTVPTVTISRDEYTDLVLLVQALLDRVDGGFPGSIYGTTSLDGGTP